MKYGRLISVLVAVGFLLALAPSCSRTKTIPDKQLTQIFKEVFLTNAFVQSNRHVDPVRDSLDIYRPILQSYGYTQRDFEYTLANFSKRKSVKLSDVVERAIKELDAEESDFRFRASLLDTVDARAQRNYLREIIRDSSIRVTAVRDTALLELKIPVREGVYDIAYFYEVDSTDKNRQLKTTYVITDADGKTTNTNSTWMSSRRRTKVDQTLTPADTDSLLTIRFGNYTKELTRPNLTIDSLKIYYKPTLKEALDSMDRGIMPYKTILDQWR